jgi:hypothetical protein
VKLADLSWSDPGVSLQAADRLSHGARPGAADSVDQYYRPSIPHMNLTQRLWQITTDRANLRPSPFAAALVILGFGYTDPFHGLVQQSEVRVSPPVSNS